MLVFVFMVVSFPEEASAFVSTWKGQAADGVFADSCCRSRSTSRGRAHSRRINSPFESTLQDSFSGAAIASAGTGPLAQVINSSEFGRAWPDSALISPDSRQMRGLHGLSTRASITHHGKRSAIYLRKEARPNHSLNADRKALYGDVKKKERQTKKTPPPGASLEIWPGVVGGG
jgi:hypothetical protein